MTWLAICDMPLYCVEAIAQNILGAEIWALRQEVEWVALDMGPIVVGASTSYGSKDPRPGQKSKSPHPPDLALFYLFYQILTFAKSNTCSIVLFAPCHPERSSKKQVCTEYRVRSIEEANAEKCIRRLSRA